MQISNNYSPAFTSIHSKISDMTSAQRRLATALANSLDYSDEYAKARDEVGVYFLPSNSKSGLNVRFMDHDSDMLYRTDDGKMINLKMSERSNFEEALDAIKQKLTEIITGKYEKPEMNIEKVLNYKTDKAKMNPDAIEDLSGDVDYYMSVMSRDAAEDMAVRNYFESPMSRKDSDF